MKLTGTMSMLESLCVLTVDARTPLTLIEKTCRTMHAVSLITPVPRARSTHTHAHKHTHTHTSPDPHMWWWPTLTCESLSDWKIQVLIACSSQQQEAALSRWCLSSHSVRATLAGLLPRRPTLCLHSALMKGLFPGGANWSSQGVRTHNACVAVTGVNL